MEQFNFEKAMRQAQERLRAKAAGEVVPLLPVGPRQKRQSTTGFDFEAALRRAKEKSGKPDRSVDELLEFM